MTERDVAGTIGPEHDAFAELLAGYVDDELSPDNRARIEAHLAECTLCRRGLQAQTVVRARLMRETGSAESGSLASLIMDRIARHEAQARIVVETTPRHRFRWATIIAWSGWLAAAAVAGLWLLSGSGHKGGAAAGMAMSMAPAKLVMIDSYPGPISSAVMSQFERVDQSDLPREADLSLLKKAVPFNVPALKSPHMRLIAAWTTELRGEPAAAIAYRCHDRLVIQYVVSEQQFFRHAQVRRAIAQQGLYAVSEGTVSTVAWPDTDSGSFLVGEFSPAELAAMRL